MDKLLDGLDLYKLQLVDILVNYRMNQGEMDKDIDGLISRLDKDGYTNFITILKKRIEEQTYVEMNKQFLIDYPYFGKYKDNQLINMVISHEFVKSPFDYCYINIKFKDNKTLCIHWENQYRRQYAGNNFGRQILIYDTKTGLELASITAISRKLSDAALKRGIKIFGLKATKENMDAFVDLCEKHIK